MRTSLKTSLAAGAVLALCALVPVPASAAPALPALPDLVAGTSQIEQAQWRPRLRRCHWERRCWRNRWGNVRCRPIRVCRGRW